MSISKLVATEVEQELFQLTQVNGIQACVREYIPRPEHGGNLLMAMVSKSGLGVRIPVTFTGTELFDEKSEFYMEKNERYRAQTLSIKLEDHSHYYLCAEGQQVYLLKKSQEPNDEKSMFKIKRVCIPDGDKRDGKHDSCHFNERYFNIKSVSTGLYLASDKEGNAFLKRLEDPMDRQTWFYLMPAKQEASMTFTCNYDLSVEFTASFCRQSSEVEAC